MSFDKLATKYDLTIFGSEMHNDIINARQEIIRWMFFFCITNIAATAAILLLVLKK
jgi:hypothetical protein